MATLLVPEDAWAPAVGAGFLTDQVGLFGEADVWQGSTLPELLHVPCLVVVGEAGIGKSRALAVTWADIVAHVTTEGDRALLLNLGLYGSESRLVDDLFGPAALGGWDPSEQRVHLFLDSLDECQVRIGHLTALLSAHLPRYPADRLRLRIVCRAAEWPAAFEERLRGHWGRESVRFTSLAHFAATTSN